MFIDTFYSLFFKFVFKKYFIINILEVREF